MHVENSIGSYQGIEDCTGTGTFSKEPKLAKLLREPKFGTINKYPGFSCMFITRNLLCFGCLAAGHLIGGFLVT